MAILSSSLLFYHKKGQSPFFYCKECLPALKATNTTFIGYANSEVLGIFAVLQKKIR